MQGERIGWIVAVVVGVLVNWASGVTPGFVENFSAAGTAGWGGLIGATNPGTGGVGGAGDGFLRLAHTSPGNFGAMNTGANYLGNWDAAGISQVSFYLNDIDTNQDFAFRLLLSTPGGSSGTTWQHNLGLNPPNGQWQQYLIDLGDEAQWTRIRGDLSLAQVRQNVGTLHFRHDLAPYFTSPDPLAGELGVDSIALVVPEPASAVFLFAPILLCARRREQRV